MIETLLNDNKLMIWIACKRLKMKIRYSLIKIERINEN